MSECPTPFLGEKGCNTRAPLMVFRKFVIQFVVLWDEWVSSKKRGVWQEPDLETLVSWGHFRVGSDKVVISSLRSVLVNQR